MSGRLRVVSGNNQVVRSGEKTAPFVIQALNADSRPVWGVEVTFFMGVPTPNGTESSSSYHLSTDSKGMAYIEGFTAFMPGTSYVRVLPMGDFAPAVFKLTITK